MTPDELKAKGEQAKAKAAEKRLNDALQRCQKFGAQVNVPHLEQAAAFNALINMLTASGLIDETEFVRRKVEAMADAAEQAASEIATQAILAR